MSDTGSATNGDSANTWVSIFGKWQVSSEGVKYHQGQTWGSSQGKPVVGGLAASSTRWREGKVSVMLSFSKLTPDTPQGAGLVFGYVSPNDPYLYAQVGGDTGAFILGEFAPGSGWRPIAAVGEKSNLEEARDYKLEVAALGQKFRLLIDGVQVFEHVVASSIPGGQIGLIATGVTEISFSNPVVSGETPRVFVAMQFGEPFDTIYREVIKPGGEKRGVEVFRIDEIARPGIIFEDIKRQIEESKAVIAEITAPNQNVFYELGYAHALKKPTILLARRDKELPFDIRSYRVIFYDDSIGGKPEVERALDKHLRAVLQDQ